MKLRITSLNASYFLYHTKATQNVFKDIDDLIKEQE